MYRSFDPDVSAHGSGSTAYGINGLNQVTSVGGASTAHDINGNLTTDPVTGKAFAYSSDDLLMSATGNYGDSYRIAVREGRFPNSGDTILIRKSLSYSPPDVPRSAGAVPTHPFACRNLRARRKAALARARAIART